MAGKKAQKACTESLSIHVVKNGYKAIISGGVGCGIVWMGPDGRFESSNGGSLNGEFVFQDFAALISFLRKSLKAPGS
jgi:hypothetical protein